MASHCMFQKINRGIIMAHIKPFKRIRPKFELANEVAVLPIDSLDIDEINHIVNNKPYSFLNVTNPGRYNPEIELCETGKRLLNGYSRDALNSLLEKNILVEDDNETFYVYRQIIGERILTGLAACISIDDYINNVVKKHEFTRTEKVVDISYHLDCCDANTGAIFLVYKWKKEIQEIIDNCVKNEPEYNFNSDDGITHMIWPVEREVVDILIQLFKNVDSLYIADGHHRTAAAAKVCLDRREKNPNYTGDEEFNFFVSVLFPDKDLNILDYNRVVKDLNGLSKVEFFSEIRKSFTIDDYNEKKQFKPSTPHEFGMYLDGKWYKLVAISGTFNEKHPVKCLDACILQNNILCPILGIEDPKTDKRIDFVPGILGLEELERRTTFDMKVAFSVYPCSIQDMIEVADAGEVMPPKSTWFEPKLRNGLFIHRLK